MTTLAQKVDRLYSKFEPHLSGEWSYDGQDAELKDHILSFAREIVEEAEKRCKELAVDFATVHEKERAEGCWDCATEIRKMKDEE